MIEFPIEKRKDRATSYAKGDVLYWEGYEFPDGTGRKNSYIVFLSECINESSFLIARGTATIERYKSGKIRDFVVITPKDCPIFAEETAIDFRGIKEVSVEKVAGALSVKARPIGTIPPEILNRLTNAIVASKVVPRWMKRVIQQSRSVQN